MKRHVLGWKVLGISLLVFLLIGNVMTFAGIGDPGTLCRSLTKTYLGKKLAQMRCDNLCHSTRGGCAGYVYDGAYCNGPCYYIYTLYCNDGYFQEVEVSVGILDCPV